MFVYKDTEHTRECPGRQLLDMTDGIRCGYTAGKRSIQQQTKMRMSSPAQNPGLD